MQKRELKEVVSNLLDYLAKNIKKGEFPARTFYGETYSALAMLLFNQEKYRKEIESLISFYLYKKIKQRIIFTGNLIIMHYYGLIRYLIGMK